MEQHTLIIIIASAVVGGLCLTAFIIWLILFVRSRINPGWDLKHIDLHRGVILELTNKRSTPYTIRSLRVHVIFPGIWGEAHACLLDHIMQPNEILEIPMKLYAREPPKPGSRLFYNSEFKMSYLTSSMPGRLRVLELRESDVEKGYDGIQIRK